MRFSAKLTSVVVVTERQKTTQDIVNEEKSYVITKSDGKKQVFTFDSIIENNYEQILGPLIVDKSLQLVCFGFHSSILITGVGNDVESLIVETQLAKLFTTLNDDSGCLTNGEMVLSFEVELSCYETFADRIVDLTTEGEGKNLKILNGAVANLTRIPCVTSDSALEMVRAALRRRTVLVASRSIDIASSTNRLIGAVGHTFVKINVKQTVLSVLDGQCKTRQSTLEIVSLAAAEVLNFKAEKGENLILCPLCDFSSNETTSGKTTATSSDTDVKGNSKVLSLLQNGLQSLSTLTRVVKALKGDDSTTTATNDGGGTNNSHGIATAPSSSGKDDSKLSPQTQHIPFRDNVLTRLLQRSLQGNCSLFVINVVDGRSESLGNHSLLSHTLMFYYTQSSEVSFTQPSVHHSHPPSSSLQTPYQQPGNNLRFAAQLSKLYNYIWSNESKSSSVQHQSNPANMSIIQHKMQVFQKQVLAAKIAKETTVSSSSADRAQSNSPVKFDRAQSNTLGIASDASPRTSVESTGSGDTTNTGSSTFSSDSTIFEDDQSSPMSINPPIDSTVTTEGGVATNGYTGSIAFDDLMEAFRSNILALSALSSESDRRLEILGHMGIVAVKEYTVGLKNAGEGMEGEGGGDVEEDDGYDDGGDGYPEDEMLEGWRRDGHETSERDDDRIGVNNVNNSFSPTSSSDANLSHSSHLHQQGQKQETYISGRDDVTIHYRGSITCFYTTTA